MEEYIFVVSANFVSSERRKDHEIVSPSCPVKYSGQLQLSGILLFKSYSVKSMIHLWDIFRSQTMDMMLMGENALEVEVDDICTVRWKMSSTSTAQCFALRTRRRCTWHTACTSITKKIRVFLRKFCFG